MTQMITRTYDSFEHASSAVSALKAYGFTDEQISLVAHANEAGYHPRSRESSAGEGVGVGAGVGGALGAGVGILTGLGVMAIPGVGPVVAAGWLAATAAGAVAGMVAGAATGGIVGSLIENGVSEEDAHFYAESVRRGGSLVTVRASDELASEAIRILDSFGPIDPAVRRAEYLREGWERFDETAPGLPSPSLPATDSLRQPLPEAPKTILSR